MFRNHVSVGSFDCDSFVFVFKALLVFEDPDPFGNSYEGFCRISLNSDVFVFLMSRLGYEFCAKIKTKQTRKTHRATKTTLGWGFSSADPPSRGHGSGDKRRGT